MPDNGDTVVPVSAVFSFWCEGGDADEAAAAIEARASGLWSWSWAKFGTVWDPEVANVRYWSGPTLFEFADPP